MCEKTLLCVASLILLFSGGLFSQAPVSQQVPVPLPSEEQYIVSADLVMPWRDGGCTNILLTSIANSGCYVVPATEYRSRTTMTLFDADGKAWRVLDVNRRGDFYFGKYRDDIVPFATPGISSAPAMTFVMRVVSESPHWLRVIVNEDSGKVAYVRKDDPDWFRTTFEYWLKGWNIVLTAEQAPLLEQPNGKVIPASESIKFGHAEFIKLDKPDGEWAYVRALKDGKEYYGWVRWRDGRKFFVDCYFATKRV